MLVWDENPSETHAFVVRTEMLASQEAHCIAANPEGLRRRLSLRRPIALRLSLV
jgi:hypothetical protein